MMTMCVKKTLSAAALPIVLVVSTLMLLSIVGVFILFDRSNSEVSGSHYKMQQGMNLESAVLLYCKDSLFLDKLAADSTLQLYEDKGNSIVKLTVHKYGLYEIVRASSDKDKFIKTAVVGSANRRSNNPTFYVSNNYNPLSITGNSNLEGKVCVPKYGVSYNQMEYQVFSGEKINPKNILTSDTDLPLTIDRDALSFDTEHLCLSKDMHLEDTILIARSITVESGFVGTVQLMACDTVIIEPNVVLKYPSGIYMSKDNPDRYVEIKEKSRISGYVVIEKSETKSQNRKPNLKMHVKSEIRGVVYVNGISQLQGTVTGNVFSDKCALFTNNGTYDNTIYNLTVVENNEVTAPLFIKNASYERKIIKWLN